MTRAVRATIWVAGWGVAVTLYTVAAIACAYCSLTNR